MRRLLAIGAGCGLALGLAGAASADDERFDDEEMGQTHTITTTTTVTRSEAAPSYAFGEEGYPESDFRDEGKDPRNLLPQENPLKGLRWAEDAGDTQDERFDDR
jgi:hypothetical protein